MPSWGIHLVTANEVLKKINISEENAFFIGNVMPDAERHVIDNFSVFVEYDISHFTELQEVNGNLERLPNPVKFVNKYKNKMKNPMILGYLIHLLTDYYWNKLTAARFTIRDNNGNFIGIKLNTGENLEADKTIRRNLKHNDFYLFENELIQNTIFKLPDYSEDLINFSEEIEEINYNKDDLQKIVFYLTNKFGNIQKEELIGEYKLYTKEQMKNDFRNSI